MPSFRGLRWKLTLSYMAVTVVAMLFVALIVSVFIFSFILIPNDIVTPEYWIKTVDRSLTPTLSYLLAQDPIDLEAMRILLENIHPTLSEFGILRMGDTELTIRTTAHLDLLIVDAEGTLLAATPKILKPGLIPGRSVDASSIPGLRAPLQAALSGENNTARLSTGKGPGYELLVAVPITDYREDEKRVFTRQVVGVVVLIFESLPTQTDVPAHTMQLLSRSLLVFIIAAGLMAAIFGFVTARGLANRFHRLSAAADAWSQGNFSEFVEDPTGDELAQLAEHLNLMAMQLQNLLEARQKVAVYEERSRLARDLHDAVTQTLFSASLIAEALPEVWDVDQKEGRELLTALQRLNRGALAEMRGLLLELRPAALTEANLGDLMRQLSEAVTGRTGMPVVFTLTGDEGPLRQIPDLPLDVHVALYRIAQEALNNVVKHAEASQVTVTLRCTELAAGVDTKQRHKVELQVRDNGRGFEPGSVPPDRLGLNIIRERTQAIGAELTIESTPGSGTKIVVVWEEKQ